jgi:hypothetical protein
MTELKFTARVDECSKEEKILYTKNGAGSVLSPRGKVG